MFVCTYRNNGKKVAVVFAVDIVAFLGITMHYFYRIFKTISPCFNYDMH